MKKAGNKVICIIGVRNKKLLFWEDRFKKYSDELIICTDDGSYGIQGLVTTGLSTLLKGENKQKIDHVIAIGPVIMMKSISLLTKNIIFKQ